MNAFAWAKNGCIHRRKCGTTSAWTIEYTETARRALRKAERQTARRILDFMDERIAGTDDPRRLGHALTGEFGGRWRYRVGDYRVICNIQDGRLIVLVLEVGNRRDVYR